METLIINLISGALGGNAAGKLFSNLSLGTIGNSIAGIAGGGLGGKLLSMAGLAVGSGGLDAASILGSIAGGGVGGGAVMAIIGMIKKAMNKS